MALSTRQQKALAALLSQPTHKQAAQAAGVSERQMRTYLQNDEFRAEYRRRLDLILSEAEAQAKRGMKTAIQTLTEICADDTRSDTARVSAARAIIDAGLRLNDAVDVAQRLAALEEIADEK